MLNIDLPKLFSENPSFWNEQRRHILNLALSHASDDGRLTEPQVLNVLHDLGMSRRHIPKPVMAAVRKVLNELNEAGLLKADLPAERIRIPRPSILPNNFEEFAFLATIEAMLKYLWTDWLAQVPPEDSYLLCFAMSLPGHAGIGNPALGWILHRLEWRHLDTRGHLRIPFDAEKADSPETALSLPASARLLLGSHARRTSPPAEHYVFLPDICQAVARKKAISKQLRARYRDFCRAFCDSTGTVRYPPWNVFVSVGRLLPHFHARLEPLFLGVASTVPLPTAHPTTAFMPLTWEGLISRSEGLPALVIPNRVRAERRAAVMPEQIGAAPDLSPRWCGDARRLVSRLTRKLREIGKPNGGKLTRQTQIEAAHATIDGLLEEADVLAPNKTSALHLGLTWVRDQLSLQQPETNPKVGTIETDLSRVFTARLLRIPESYDLSSWEAEEHEMLVEEYLEDVSLDATTRDNIAIAFRKVYRFANTHGYTDGVNSGFAHGAEFYGTRRAQVIAPYEFDLFLESLRRESTRDALLIAAACALGYYAGLRAGDVMLLTLGDAVIGDGEIWIEIQHGKTPAARRRIGLHLLAPEPVCQLIRETYDRRRGEFRESSNLRQISLFGPEGAPDGYTRNALIDTAIAELQARFGINTVFHSLRHAFASWILVRWYALRYPEAIEVLVARRHAIFQPEAQARLAELFTLGSAQTTNPDDPSALIVISKLMGHLGQQTLFARYIHTFQILHADAMKRVDTVFGAQHVSGKVIAALLPRMTSATTRAKHKAKTINDLLAVVADDVRSL